MNLKLLSVSSLLVLTLGGCIPARPPEDTPTSSSTTEVVPVVEDVTESTFEYQIPSVTTDDVLKVLRDGTRDVGVVGYNKDNNTFILTPNAVGFATDIVRVLETGDTTDWNKLKQSYLELSLQVSDMLYDPNVCLAIANPANPSNLLLIVSDGELLYDGIYEALGY